jgi:ATP-dependent Clp protease ATP-binding subunit ClpA
LIQRKLQDPIAMAILEGRFHEGDVVEVDASGEQLTIGGTVVDAPAPEATIEV